MMSSLKANKIKPFYNSKDDTNTINLLGTFKYQYYVNLG